MQVSEEDISDLEFDSSVTLVQAPGGDRATLQQLLQSTGRMIKVLLPAWYILVGARGYVNSVSCFISCTRFPLICIWAP